MDISILSIDIDGTLHNPLIAMILALYGSALAVIALLVVRRIRLRRSPWRRAVPVATAIFILAIVNGPIIRGVAAVVVAAGSSFHGSVGVGYFGHHPVWIVPALVVAGALLGTLRGETGGPAVA